jgi:hypothetical protein
MLSTTQAHALATTANQLATEASQLAHRLRALDAIAAIPAQEAAASLRDLVDLLNEVEHTNGGGQ